MIEKKHLAPDATIVDVLPDLEEAEEYLRRVLGNMRFCQKQNGDAWLRIGITGKRSPGKGLSPSYRIDYPAASGSPEMTIYNGFGGKSHSAFTPINMRETNWSRGTTAIQDVQRIYDALRRPKGMPHAAPSPDTPAD